MGAGKSSIARKLAGRLSCAFFDLDKMFEEKYRITVQDFFFKYDEAAFRKLESMLLRETESLQDCIIATGGGTPCFNGNIDWMNEHGITIFIKISPETAVSRIINSKKKRPLAQGKTEAELLEYVRQHYGNRLPYYEKAQITVKGEDFDIESLLLAVGRLL